MGSKADMDLVRSIYARWQNGDFSSAEWAHPDIEFTAPDGTITHGLSAMTDAWREFLRAWSDFAAAPEEFEQSGADVLVSTRFTGQSAGAGFPLAEFPGNALFTIREGLVIRLALIGRREDALAELGAPKPGP
jgi:SnoaL-like domain